jgi:hypothetical protein
MVGVNVYKFAVLCTMLRQRQISTLSHPHSTSVQGGGALVSLPGVGGIEGGGNNDVCLIFVGSSVYLCPYLVPNMIIDTLV